MADIVPFNGDDPMAALLLRAAADPSFDVQKFESVIKFLGDREAKMNERAFNAAMALAQSELRAVFRDKPNEHLKSRYATLDAMLAVVLPAVNNHGLSIRFESEAHPDPGMMRVSMVISHRDGHVSRRPMDGPVSTAGPQGGRAAMTPMQATGSAATYLSRYLLKMAFALQFTDADDDDDGEGARQKPADSRPSTRDTPAAGAAPAQNGVDHEAYKQAFRRRLYLAIDEAAIEALLAIPDIKNWLTAAPLRITADVEAMLIAKRKLLVEQAAMKAEQEAAKAAPSALLQSLLADIASCADKAMLDKLTDSDVFAADVVRLGFMEGDQVTEAVKDRYAELGA